MTFRSYTRITVHCKNKGTRVNHTCLYMYISELFVCLIFNLLVISGRFIIETRGSIIHVYTCALLDYLCLIFNLLVIIRKIDYFVFVSDNET